jgi:hypothetical protein
MVHVQGILLASFTAFILSALLAILCLQWLKHYASTDTQGSVIKRGRRRQQKLDALDAWYFHQVIESPLVMLGVAFFLLICAISRYLWDMLNYYVLVLYSYILRFRLYLFGARNFIHRDRSRAVSSAGGQMF